MDVRARSDTPPAMTASPPMIQTQGLARSYGGRIAVHALDATVARGEVLGLLGVNGAGKTTTLRMLAGALAATSGAARIAGFDVFEQPLEVKRRVGYLPEVPPLYDDMTVRDHVRYGAVLHGVADDRRAADAALERTGISDVADRIVGHLSKGYRQRVGLALALVHSPQVLLLDEPASGLDPAQRVAMRTLVRELSDGDVTVVLSTHVLPEVEALCDRVLVMHQGRVVARDSMQQFSASRGVRLRVGRPEGLAEALGALEGIDTVDVLDTDTFLVRSDTDVRALVARTAAPHDLLELTREGGLEAAFLRVTGGEP